MYPFSSDSAYDSFTYGLLKTRLSESEAEAEDKTITIHIPALCDWFNSSTSACDSNNPVFTWSETTEFHPYDYDSDSVASEKQPLETNNSNLT